jgi:Capsule polysaccharide biosynthesis protein
VNLLVIQQLAWGLRIGHSLAVALHARGYRLAAMVHGLETWKHVQTQTAVPYAHRWLADTVYDDGAERVPDALVREIEGRYELDSVWRLAAADRVLAVTFHSSRRFSYRKPRSNDYVLSVIASAYRRVRDMLDTWSTDCVVSPNVASLMNYVLFLEAKCRKVPFYTVGYSRFGRTFLIGDDRHMMSTRVRERFAELRERPEASPRYPEAKRLHERMLANERGVRPSYLPSAARERPLRRLGRLAVATARLPLSGVAAVVRHRPALAITNIWLPNNSRTNLLRGIWINYRERWRRADRQGPAIRDLSRIDFDFVFYPLQVEPEMTLMMWAPQFANQIELCRRLALGLPAGVRLVAKEHPNMVAARRASFYRKLHGLLNVELVHSTVSAAEVFSHPRCRGVAVINSTAGFEAAMAGVPVAVLGPAEYDLLPTIQRAATYEAAIAALRSFCLEPRRPRTAEELRATQAYLAALVEEGFEADYTEAWAGGDEKISPGAAIADALERRLGGGGPVSS